jgi:acyl-CoA reductase-like NAD-dependent aldehyde dehydrogenase
MRSPIRLAAALGGGGVAIRGPQRGGQRHGIFSEETFAPIVCITRAQNLDDAARRADASDFGLTSLIFTSNIELGFRLAAQLNVGVVSINGSVYSQPHLPFGRFFGTAAIREFTELQTV